MTGQFCKYACDDGACPEPCAHEGRCDARIQTIDAIRFIDGLTEQEAFNYQSHPNSTLRAVSSWRCQTERFGPWEATKISVCR